MICACRRVESPVQWLTMSPTLTVVALMTLVIVGQSSSSSLTSRSNQRKTSALEKPSGSSLQRRSIRGTTNCTANRVVIAVVDNDDDDDDGMQILTRRITYSNVNNKTCGGNDVHDVLTSMLVSFEWHCSLYTGGAWFFQTRYLHVISSRQQLRQ